MFSSIQEMYRVGKNISVSGSTKLYKAHICYENLLGYEKFITSSLGSENVDNSVIIGLRLYFADFLSMSKSSFTVIYRAF